MSHSAALFYMLDRCLELEMVVMYRNADLGAGSQNLQSTNVVGNFPRQFVHKCTHEEKCDIPWLEIEREAWFLA